MMNTKEKKRKALSDKSIKTVRLRNDVHRDLRDIVVRNGKKISIGDLVNEIVRKRLDEARDTGESIQITIGLN